MKTECRQQMVCCCHSAYVKGNPAEDPEGLQSKHQSFANGQSRALFFLNPAVAVGPHSRVYGLTN